MMQPSLCPCGSGMAYSNCCQPYHMDTQKPPSALALMRSRYSAYATGNVDYIIKTTHPSHQDRHLPEKKRRAAIETFCRITRFTGLEIIDYSEEESIGFVFFRANLMQDDQDVSFTEKSTFEKIGDQWYYLKGIIHEN